MDQLDSKLLSELQRGISLSNEPFREIADKLEITSQEVIERIASLQKSEIIRRFGVCIKPNDLGLFANALVAWKVTDDRIQEVGTYLSRLKEITHCYKRTPIAGKWEYNLYTVMHAQKRKTIEWMVKDISKAIKVTDYSILYSVKNLKKENSSITKESPASTTKAVNLEVSK